MKNQGNNTPNEHNNFALPDLPKTEICDLSEKEFKMHVLRKFTELQHKKGQLNEIRHNT